MLHKNLFNIIINERYSLAPLISVDKDDITPLFKNGKGIYICNYPDQNWYDFHNFERKKNYSIEKKDKFFQLMNDGSMILSPTQDSTIKKSTKSLKNIHLVHLGSIFTGRLAQIHFSIQMMIWLFRNRRKYDYCLVYNFYPPEMISAFFARYVLNKQIIVDFEDNNMLQTTNTFYQFYFRLVKNIPNSIICINENMRRYFYEKLTYVFNGFIDLDYTSKIDFTLKKGYNFLYAGALDDIRGIDLIPDVVFALRRKIRNFTISIAGSGPLENKVDSWKLEEVMYLGFLTPSAYEKVLDKADVFLVLQKPDHAFSLGSFPSKIEFYTKYKKPIYKIILN